MKITRQEFLDNYAARAHKSPDELAAYMHTYGRIVLPCSCEAQNCEGWQSVPLELVDTEVGFDRVTRAEADEALRLFHTYQ